MRQIKVSYRAVFAQPQGPLNPSGFKMAGRFPVEIFGHGESWQAREIATPQRVVYKKFKKFASPENAMGIVAEAFYAQLEPWQIWGMPPIDHAKARDFNPVERLLSPDEIQVLQDGRVLWKEAEDYTHILHAPDHTNMKAGMPPAACGAKVSGKAFVNNRANVEPTCKKCAEVWRQFYQEKST